MEESGFGLEGDERQAVVRLPVIFDCGHEDVDGCGIGLEAPVRDRNPPRAGREDESHDWAFNGETEGRWDSPAEQGHQLRGLHSVSLVRRDVWRWMISATVRCQLNVSAPMCAPEISPTGSSV